MKNRKEIYINGLDMNQFENIDSISSYNHNYYIGFGQDLLFAKSDDDNTTEWYLVDESFIYLGESYCTENEILHRYNETQR